MEQLKKHKEPRTTCQADQNKGYLQPDHLKRLHKRHLQGAFIRSGASLFMWLFALFAFLAGIIKSDHFAGVSISVVFLILMNPPTLWVLKRITSRSLYKYFSLVINSLEIIGYTVIIYFLGGIEATYLVLMYAALIIYVGVAAPERIIPFIIAGFCAFSFILMVLLEHFGLIPHQRIISDFNIPWNSQLMILFMTSGLLFVVAFISSYTAQLLKSNRDKLRRQNAELKLAINRARESDRMKSEFLANMSHELRTPLNHIIGFTELVVDKNCGDLNETQEEYLNDVLGSSKHLLSLINDILDLAKVEAGKLQLEPSDVNLQMIIENSLCMIKDKAMQHGIQLSMDMDSIPETIKADERKLKQIMYNLFSNAMKFTPDGGSITLAAKMQTEYSVPEHKNPDEQTNTLYPIPSFDRNFIEISVNDTGIGLKPEDLERIFDAFEQVESSKSRKYQGTGLGLSLTKRLVELHGGRIWAESEGENKGSTFLFIIPV